MASQQFTYQPTAAAGPQQMALGSFNTAFKDVAFLIVTFTPQGGEALLGSDLVLFMDDFTYSYTQCPRV